MAFLFVGFAVGLWVGTIGTAVYHRRQKPVVVQPQPYEQPAVQPQSVHTGEPKAKKSKSVEPDEGAQAEIGEVLSFGLSRLVKDHPSLAKRFGFDA